jgi:GH25 family lysozyme M1 (1,4-beta-N-acetylmuramidase)
MTVQELIDQLNQVKNKNLKIVVKGTDPTDWVYNNDVEGVSEENVFYENIENCYYRRRLVIDGGIF